MIELFPNSLLPDPDELNEYYITAVAARKSSDNDAHIPEQLWLKYTIRDFRSHLGLTQRQLANQLGVSALIVRYWEQEHSHHYPSKRNFEKILTLYRDNYPSISI